MIEMLTDIVGVFIALFVAMLLVFHRGLVSNSRISLFSMVVVVYEAGDDTFNSRTEKNCLNPSRCL